MKMTLPFLVLMQLSIIHRQVRLDFTFITLKPAFIWLLLPFSFPLSKHIGSILVIWNLTWFQKLYALNCSIMPHLLFLPSLCSSIFSIFVTMGPGIIFVQGDEVSLRVFLIPSKIGKPYLFGWILLAFLIETNFIILERLIIKSLKGLGIWSII